jgi:hypothetical protein
VLPVAPKPPAEEPKPFPLPAPTPVTPGLESLKPQPAANLAPSGKFVVLRGNKLVEGEVTVTGDKVVVRQGALDRPFPKADVFYVAASKDEVYRFMLATASATDPAARLAVARWCMFNGLREQALAESREILKLQPQYKAAADLARSLEQSLREFPPGGPAVVKPHGTLVTVTEPEPDVTAEGATTFATRAQPILANQCMECHSRADHASAFKLTRVTGFEVGPQSTHANLRAVAAQLKKDDPLNSPLLVKALATHGGMKQPAFVSRQAVAYRALEAWVLLAAGNASASVPPPPMTPPVQPVLPPTPPVTPIPPITDSGASRPVPSPVPVPESAVSRPPLAPTTPVTPPTVPVVAKPVLPPVEPPPSVVPPVLPTPPSIPPADTGTRTLPATIPPIPVVPDSGGSRPPLAPATNAPASAPVMPMIPTIPPAASLPKPPDAVKSASGSGTGSGQFGTGTKPPAPSGPMGDEFDPAGFNRGVQPKK